MNIVVVDSGRLHADADFPMLTLDKFGWQQFVQLENQKDVIERCWRSDVIVSAATPIDGAVIDRAFKLKLIVAAGENIDHIDLEAARKRNVTVCNVPGRRADKTPADQQICEQVIDNIDAFIKDRPINRV